MKIKAKANYEIVARCPNLLRIRDVGPWDEVPTVSSDIHNVVDDLWASWLIRDDTRLELVDSLGRLNLVVHECGRFCRFEDLYWEDEGDG